MSYKLFLDDVRNPSQCVGYMYDRIGSKNLIYAESDWLVAKCYEDFVGIVEKNGIPDFVSYDHDLADIHYDPRTWTEGFEYKEKTGFDCAKWLKSYCKGKGIKHPEYAVHSMNPVGTTNIQNYIGS